MDFSNLFSGSDNFYKYLSIGGFILVLISLFYPLQKKQEVDIEIVTFNQEAAMLNLEIKKLYVIVCGLNKESETYKNKINILENRLKKNNSDNKEIFAEIERVRREFNNKMDSCIKFKNNIDVKNVALTYNKKKAETMKKYLDTYKSFSHWFLVVGIIFSIFGSIFWFRSTRLNDKIKKKELVP